MRVNGSTKSFAGFTLIELLIVVAIIAILAAIAVPNLLEAQVRAKVARVQSEFRNLATAIEIYHMDNNWYPQDYMVYEHCGWDHPGSPYDFELHLRCLTTPVAYLTTLPSVDPFNDPGGGQPPGKYFYENVGDHWYLQDVCMSGMDPKNAAPHHHLRCREDPQYFLFDTIADALDKCYLWILRSHGPDRTYEFMNVLPYDVTNGTISRGEIVRVGP